MSVRFAVFLVVAACGAHEPAAPKTSVKTAVDAAPIAGVVDAAAPTAAQRLRLPDSVEPLGYELRLDVDPTKTTFAGDVTIRVRIKERVDRVWLHVDGLDLESSTWAKNGASGTLTPVVPAKGAPDDDDRGEMGAFALGATVDPGEATLSFRYTGHVTDEDLEGVFRQKHRGEWYLFTQSESVFARRILPCFDEPRWKVPWRVTLVVPPNAVALSNAPIASRVGNIVTFETTPPMASYLLAFAVGPFAVIDSGTVGANNVKLRVAVPKGDAASARVTAIETPPLVAKLEAYFGSPLPWGKVDFVAVPSFFGAMENPGLVTFDRSMLVGDPSRVRGRFTRVAGHELAHYWFGDWVTFAWWDDLWLAEGFASWMSDKLVDESAYELARARSRAMVADDEPDAHPLHRTIEKSSDAETRFDAISYEKGAAVLSMFESFVGEDAFRTGIRAYLDAHHGGNATSKDLFAAIAAATNPNVAASFTAYVEQASVPVVELALRCDAGVPPVVVASSKTKGHPVPVCLRVAGGKTPICTMVADRTEIALAASSGVGVGVGSGSGVGSGVGVGSGNGVGSGVGIGIGSGSGVGIGSGSGVGIGSGVGGSSGSGVGIGSGSGVGIGSGFGGGSGSGSGNGIGNGIGSGIGMACPSWVVGNAGGTGYYRVAGSLPHAPLAELAPRERVAFGDEVAASLARGATPSADALAQIDALVKSNDAYAVTGALAIVRLFDRVVDDTTRPAWTAWIAKTFAPVFDLTGDIRFELVELGAVPTARAAKARKSIAPKSANGWTVAVAASALDRTTFDTLKKTFVGRGRNALGMVPPQFAAEVVTLALDGDKPAWGAIETLLERGATRSLAWAALRPRLPELVAKLGPDDATDVIVATRGMCDATARGEVIAAFTPFLDDIRDGKPALAHAAAAIDRCIALRATIGAFKP